MSTKEEKPTLAGVQIKTRKRNIAVSLDPVSFADTVIASFDGAWDDAGDLEKNLQHGVKVIDGADIDFSRYGDTLFELFFAGNRLSGGGNVVDEGRRLKIYVLSPDCKHEDIVPLVKTFQTLLRRRPFLVRPLENTLIKLQRSLDFYDDDSRQKLAIALARCFALKLGLQPDRVLIALLNDRMIAKGLILQFVTAFFQDYLSTESLDELIVLLKKTKLDNRLLEFFPPQRQSISDFNDHFEAAGLGQIAEFNRKKVLEVELNKFNKALDAAILQDPPANADELMIVIDQAKKESDIPDLHILQSFWNVAMSAISTTGKNNQQILAAMTRQIKLYQKIFDKYCSTAKLEASILVHIQVYCYEDSKLLKLFSDIVKVLYNLEIIGEDTIFWWYKKGSHHKGRQVFLRDLEPFVKWLEEAEEEDD